MTQDMAEKRRQELAAKQGEKPPAGTAPPAEPPEEEPPAPPQEPAEETPAEEPEEERPVYAGAVNLLPKGFTPPAAPGPCSKCGSELKIISINSRVRAWACVKPRCDLYRERIVTFSVPARKPRPAPAKAKGGKGADKGKVNKGNPGGKPKEKR